MTVILRGLGMVTQQVEYLNEPFLKVAPSDLTGTLVLDKMN